MDTSLETPRPPIRKADLLVFDREDRRLLLVEVKLRVKSPEVVATLRRDLDDFDFPFGMLVDRDQIRIFDREHPEPILVLPTATIFGAYHPDFRTYYISELYLKNMTECWLADFAIFWKSPQPPGMDALSRIGVAERLYRCTIDGERELWDGAPLHRDELPDELRFGA